VSVPGRKIDLQLVEHTAKAPPVSTEGRGGRRFGRDEKRKPLRPAPSRKHDRGAKHERGKSGSNGRPGGKSRGGGGGGRGGGKRGRR